MDNEKIGPYKTSLERYVVNASEAQSIKSYRRSLDHILKIGLMAVNATTAVVCHFDVERMESTVIAETRTNRANENETESSDLGEVYDEREYPLAYAWLTGDHSRPLRLEREKLDKDSAEYNEFIEYGFFTAIYCPIKVEEYLWGYVEIWESRYPRPFSDDELELLQSMTDYIAKAVAANDPSDLR